IAALSFPTAISILWMLNKTPPVWFLTITVLLVELKFLFYLLLGIIVFAFAHSLHILLRPTTDFSYDQPSYTDDVNNPWNLATRYQSILPN
ncbi:3804_t:CDS:2, partial [Dentiscutata heterogama]